MLYSQVTVQCRWETHEMPPGCSALPPSIPPVFPVFLHYSRDCTNAPQTPPSITPYTQLITPRAMQVTCMMHTAALHLLSSKSNNALNCWVGIQPRIFLTVTTGEFATHFQLENVLSLNPHIFKSHQKV